MKRGIVLNMEKNLTKESQNAAYLAKLERALEQLENGDGVQKTMEELEKMEME